MAEEKVGKVTHYFGHLGVAAVSVTEGELRVGDTIHIVGHTSNFTQVIDTMQLEHEAISVATAGQDVGIQVKEHAREHDEVFKVTPE